MREARVIPLINQLLKEGANITAYDPVAVSMAKTVFEDKIQYAVSAVGCLRGADCAILVTEWPEFELLTPKVFVDNMKKAVLVDGRRFFDPEAFKNKVTFIAVGLGSSR